MLQSLLQKNFLQGRFIDEKEGEKHRSWMYSVEHEEIQLLGPDFKKIFVIKLADPSLISSESKMVPRLQNFTLEKDEGAIIHAMPIETSIPQSRMSCMISIFIPKGTKVDFSRSAQPLFRVNFEPNTKEGTRLKYSFQKANAPTPSYTPKSDCEMFVQLAQGAYIIIGQRQQYRFIGGQLMQPT